MLLEVRVGWLSWDHGRHRLHTFSQSLSPLNLWPTFIERAAGGADGSGTTAEREIALSLVGKTPLTAVR